MKRTLGTAILCLGLMVIGTQDAAGQDRPQVREGFFIGFGLGWGSLSCDNCGGERESGLSGFLKLGGTINEKLLLGFESNGWTKEEEGVRLSHSNGSAVAYFYPQPESGFFLKGGIGISNLDLGIDGLGSASETGLGLVAGLGYDARVGAMLSLSPYANYLYGSFDGGSTNVIQAGIGLTWH